MDRVNIVPNSMLSPSQVLRIFEVDDDRTPTLTIRELVLRDFQPFVSKLQHDFEYSVTVLDSKGVRSTVDFEEVMGLVKQIDE